MVDFFLSTPRRHIGEKIPVPDGRSGCFKEETNLYRDSLLFCLLEGNVLMKQTT